MHLRFPFWQTHKNRLSSSNRPFIFMSPARARLLHFLLLNINLICRAILRLINYRHCGIPLTPYDKMTLKRTPFRRRKRKVSRYHGEADLSGYHFRRKLIKWKSQAREIHAHCTSCCELFGEISFGTVAFSETFGLHSLTQRNILVYKKCCGSRRNT